MQRTTIEALQQENDALRQRIKILESQLAESNDTPLLDPFETVAALTNPDIRRFGRQLILPRWGKASKSDRSNWRTEDAHVFTFYI
jgi:adenylyltransferase/sulfurtransferase